MFEFHNIRVLKNDNELLNTSQ